MEEQPDDLPHRATDGETETSRDDNDESWDYLILLVSAAAACLLLYFILMPSFYPDGTDSAAKSARPGAATQTTTP